ncbi:MAG: ECF transporter S component [Acholeplasmataceae bacterium]|nr:ECF transporter S component [Acholeplasmataceae bacterium]
MSNYLRLKKMLYVVSLAAVSIILSLIEIPWFPPFSFLKIDLSEVAILIALLVLGSKETIMVVLIRTIARRLFRGFDPADLVGEMLAMFASFAIIFAFNMAKSMLKDKSKPLMYEVSVDRNPLTLKDYIIYTLSISIVLTFVLTTINYFFATPLFLTLPPIALSESGRVHFWAFTFIEDSFYTSRSYLTFVLSAYIPFNLVKGSLVTIIFLMLKPKIKYLEL